MASSIFTVHEMINKVGFEFDESTAKKVTQLAERAGRLAADGMTTELSGVVAEIGGIFNKALTSIGKQQIDLTDMIKTPDSGTIAKLTSSFVSQIAEGISDVSNIGVKIGDSIADGIVHSIDGVGQKVEEKFNALIKKRNQAVQEMEKLENQVRVKTQGANKLDKLYEGLVSNRNVADADDPKFIARVQDVLVEFMDINDKLLEMDENGKVNQKTLETWLSTAKELSTIYNTIYEMDTIKRSKMTPQIGKVNMEYILGGQYDDDIEFGTGIVEDFIDTNINEDVLDKIDLLRQKINDLDVEISELTTKHPELIDEKSTLKAEERLNQVKEAYDRLFKTRGKNKGQINKDNVSNISAGLNYKGTGKETLDELGDKYIQSVGDNWETRAKHLLKFVKKFEYIANDPTIDTEELQRWTDLYNQLKPMFAESQAMLQSVYNMVEGKEPVDMSRIEIGVEIAEQERIATEASANAEKEVADAARITVEATARKAEEERQAAEAAEKKRIADEAAALASQQAAEAAEKEKQAKETLGKVKPDNIQTILEDMNRFLSSNKDAKIRDYFTSITTGAYEMSNDVKSAIETTIGSISTLSSIDIGANNLGGLIGEKSALILRKPHFDRDKQKWDTDKQNNDAIELQNRLSSTNISDVNLGKIQEVIKAEEYLVELQNRVSGAPISTIGEAIETINPDVLNVTETSVRSLIQAMRELYNAGVECDVENLGNILYDGQSDRFGIVDMGIKEGTRSFESFEEMLSAFAQNVRYQTEDIVNILNNPNMAQAWFRFADMVDNEVRKVITPQNLIEPQNDIGADSGKKTTATQTQTTVPNSVSSSEVAELDSIQSKLKDVTAAINTKTQAFIEEEKEVKRVADAEVGHLESLENRISEIQNKFTNLLNDINTKQVKIDINSNIGEEFKQEGSVVDGVINEELGALQKLRASINLTTKGVNSKTDAFVFEGKTVGQVVGKEIKALIKLNTQAKQVSETISKLLANVKTVVNVTNASKGININVKTSFEDGKKATPKPSNGSTSDTPKRNKSDLTQLEKQYEKLGKLYARLDDDNYATQSAFIENLEDEIKRKQESLKLTEKEISVFKEKMTIAEQAENRIIQGEQEQAAKEKEIADNLKFARSVETLYGQYEKLGVLQAQADAGDLGKAEEARQLEKIIQQETEKLKLNESQNAEILKSLQLRQQEAKENKASVLAEKERGKTWKDSIKEAQKTKGVNAANSAITAGRNTVINTIGNVGLTSDVEAKAKELADEIEELERIKTEVKQAIATGQDVDQTELNQSIKKVKELKTELDKLNQIHDKYSGDDVESKDVDVDAFNNLKPEERARQMERLAQAMTKGKLREADYNAETGELTAKVKEGTNTFKTYSFAIDAVDGQFKKLNTGTKKTETFIEGISRKMKEAAQYVMGSLSIYDVWNQIKRGIQYVKEIDSALTELKKVTDETEETYERFVNTASKTADKVGSTIKEIVSSTADWARLGYSMEQAARLAESTSILLNVSEFQSIDEATNALTSTLQAFGYTAEQSMDVVDVMNEVGNNFAVSSDGIATALQDSASALMTANNSYQESVALIAAANRVVQDPNSVGSALRTISLRLRGTSTKELEEAGEDTTGVVESKSKLRTKIKGYTGIDILTDSGAYKSTYEILLEISKVWDNLTDQDRAGLLELIAGKNRANTAAAILSNTKDLEAAYESAMNAEGSALAENEKYLDSIQGRIDLFNNSVQTMWNNTLDSDWVKWFVDVGTWLVKLIDNLGAIKTLVIGIGSYMLVKRGVFDDFLGKKTVQSTEKIKHALDELKTARDSAASAVTKDPTNKKKQEALSVAQTNLDAYEKSMSPKISEYEKLNNELKTAQSNLDKYQTRLDNYSGNNENTIKRYKTSVNSAQKEVANLETKLKETEVQTNITGNAGVTAGQKFKSGFKTAGVAVANFGKQLIASMATMYLMTTIFELIVKLGEGIAYVYDEYIEGETAEDAKEKFDELNSELSNTTSELRGLESELDSTNDRIEELLQQDTLSLVEQEELNKLQSTSAELERQIELQETLQKQQQKSVNDAALHAADMYMTDTSFYSDKSKSERQEEAKETGETIGKAAGAAIGGAIGSLIPGGTIVGAGIGSALGGLLGGAIGSSSESASYDAEMSVGEALDDMSSIRAGLQADVDAARDAINENGEATEEQTETLREAEQALADFDAGLGDAITQINQYLNAIDYSLLTDKDHKQNYLDKLRYSLAYNIEMGVPGSKTTAVETLFDDKYLTDELKKVKEAVQVKIELGEDFDFSDIEISDEAKTQLSDASLTVTDVIAVFKQLKKTEDEALIVDTHDMINEISKVTSGIEELKNAFEEFNESGLVTAETLMKLSETFGHLDAWDDYVKTLASGVASTEEAVYWTNQLAEGMLTDIISHPITLVDNLDTTDVNEKVVGYQALLATISQLQALGVKNAWDLVPAMNQKAVAKVVADEIRLYDELLEKKEAGETLTQDEQALLDKGNLSMQQRIEAAEQKYGVEIENTEAIEDQVELLKVQEDLERVDKYDAYFNGSTSDYLSQYNASAEKYNDISEEIDELNEELTALDSQGYSSAIDVADSFGGAWAQIPNAFGEAIDDMWLIGNLFDIDTAYDDYDEILKDILNKTHELDDTTEKRKELFNELVEIAKVEGVDLSDIDVDAFDPMTMGEGSIFNQVYDKVKPALEAKKAELKAQEEELKKKIDTAFTEVGLEVVLDLINEDKAIDDIQSVYDALKNAQKEYADTGYISIDTMQSLLGLEPKYLALLFNEKGQLELNEEALYRVAEARITDMSIAQQNAIVEQALALATTGSRDALLEYTEATHGAATATESLVSAQLSLLRTTLDNRVKTGNWLKDIAEGRDLTQEEANSIFNNTVKSVDAVEMLREKTMVGIRKGGMSSAAKGEVSDAFKEAMDYWENRIGAEQSRFEQVQNEIDLLEKQGKKAGEGYYEEQIASENRRLKLLEQQKAEAQKYLKQFKTGSDEWWDAANTLNDIENEIDGVTASIQDLADAIAEVNWYQIEEPLKRFDDLTDTLGNMRDLIAPNGEEDWFDDEGMWTEKGAAVAGTYITEIAFDEKSLKQTQDTLAQLSKPYEGNEQYYKDLGLSIDSEQDLYDRKAEFQKKEQDYQKNIIDNQQAIADMYESQIDAIEEWANEAVGAYQDYIDVVKEALDAERDLYEFKKDVQKQTKDIASLERRIASLSGSDNAADIAERRKLEAELYEAREGLDDTYYTHAKDAQQQALEDESAAYEESMNKFIEGLRTSLETALLDMDLFMQGVTSAVMTNAPAIIEQYNGLGIALDGAIIDPWTEAANAITKFGGVDGLGVMNSWVTEGGAIYKFDTEATKLLKSPWEEGKKAADSFNDAIDTAMGSVVGSIRTNVSNSITELNKLKTEMDKINDTTVKPSVTGVAATSGTAYGQPSSNDIKALQGVLNDVFSAGIKVDGKLGPSTTAAIKKAQKIIGVTQDGKYGTGTREAMIKYIDSKITSMQQLPGSSMIGQGVQLYKLAKSALPNAFHAKGTLGTKRDELAITDESWIGEEITLAAGKNGQLQYLKKGSAVLPSDIATNLVEWGKLNPNMMNISSPTAGINMISSCINKPEVKLDIENFLRCDNVSQDTLPELKRFVNEQMNSLVKQLNYSLKKSGAR